MLRQAFALAERLIPRVLSAAVVFVLAYFTSPEAVGVYGWGILIHTAYQALTDSAARHVLIRSLHTSEGSRFLKRYRFYASTLGFLALTLAITVLWFALPENVAMSAFLLFPLCFTPLATAMGIRSVGVLQTRGKWHVLAQGQLVAALCAVSISLPILLATKSILGASVQVLATEIFFASWCAFLARKLRLTSVLTPPEPKGVNSQFWSMSAYSGLAWLQGQGDRVLIGLIAGPSRLGTFSVASSLARSVGDPLAASTANLVRVGLHSHPDLAPKEVRQLAAPILYRGLGLAILGVVAAILLTVFVAQPFLSSDWDTALSIVPILALASIPSTLSWSGSVLQVTANTSWRSLWAPIVGVGFAPLIAVLALTDLDAAAWVVIVRELVVMTTSFLLVRKHVPWHAYWACVILTGCGAAVVMATSG